jgi:hypothetical protein
MQRSGIIPLCAHVDNSARESQYNLIFLNMFVSFELSFLQTNTFFLGIYWLVLRCKRAKNLLDAKTSYA